MTPFKGSLVFLYPNYVYLCVIPTLVKKTCSLIYVCRYKMDTVTLWMEHTILQLSRTDKTDKYYHLKYNFKDSKANFGRFIWALVPEEEKGLELLSIAMMIKVP